MSDDSRRESPVALAAPRPAGAPRSSFDELAAEFRSRLERRLAAWLAQRAGEISEEAADALELAGQLETYVLGGGKRLRPALLWFAYHGAGGQSRGLMPAAMALELLHTYLLIHDDIMDRSETRRGAPSAHRQFREDHRDRGWSGSAEHHGEATAILLGDLAYAYATELFHQAPAVARAGAPAREAFSAMCREVILGQYLEMTAPKRTGLEPEDLLTVLRMKSGSYSVERPIELGALLAGAPPAVREPLAAMGRALGEAFQLQDDLLGLLGDSAEVGKPVDSDLAEGKRTLLIHYTLAAADPESARVVRRALGNPDLTRGEVEAVREVVRATGADRRIATMIDERLGGARELLAGVELAGEARDFFLGLTHYLGERRK